MASEDTQNRPTEIGQDRESRGVRLPRIKQILSDEKRQEVIALGRLGSRYGALRGNLKAWVSRIGEGVNSLNCCD